MGVHVEDAKLTPKGTETITSLGSATALTVPAGARLAFIQAETQAVRWWPTGDPTASAGHRLTTQDAGLWLTSDLSLARFIEESAGAKLQVSYYN